MLRSETYQQIIRAYQTALQSGALKPLDKGYSELQLARVLHLPRKEIREVCPTLSLLGMLCAQQSRPSEGDELHRDAEIVYLLTQASGGEFRDALAVRRILETGGAQAAANNRSEEDLCALRRYARIIQESDDPRALARSDSDLHLQLLKASGNPLLSCLLRIVLDSLARVSLEHWTETVRLGPMGRRREYTDQTWDLIRAMEDGSGPRLLCILQFHFDTLEREYGLRP